MNTEDLRSVLREEADRLDGREPLAPQARAQQVVGRAETSGARRRGGIGAAVAVAAVATVAAVVVVPQVLPDTPLAPPTAAPPPDGMVETPPKLAGYAMPQRISVRGTTYQYTSGQQVDQARERLLVAVAPSSSRRILAWSTTNGTPGQVVVSVDGDRVSRSSAGGLEYGVVLRPDRTHLVVVRATRPVPGKRIGVAFYGPLRF
jgi:hypothetical protein